ncbi:MAG: hypothetical protein AB9846_13940 [Tenuifilaceae bacterium]
MKERTFKIPLIISFLLSFMTSISYCQENKVIYYYRNYHCFDFVKRCELEILKIKNLDTLIYVTSSEFHGEYEEIHGKLSKINDSIYFVKTFKHLRQSGNGDKPFSVAKDSIFFFCDSSLIKSNIWIEYLNGQKEQHKIYSTENKFWINEKLFNTDKERLYFLLDSKNPIVDENVEIVSKYFDPKFCIGFISLRQLDDFYIIVNDKHVMTLSFGSEGHQSIGPIFIIDRMKQGTKLPKGRKLYD